MDLQKIIAAIRDKKQSLTRNGSGASLTKYLKANGIRRIGITRLTRMINDGELAGKTVIQTDYSLSYSANKLVELEGLDAADVFFLVMDKETAEKILVLGMP